MPNEGAQFPRCQRVDLPARRGVQPELDRLCGPISEDNGFGGAGIGSLQRRYVAIVKAEFVEPQIGRWREALGADGNAGVKSQRRMSDEENRIVGVHEVLFEEEMQWQ